jgi:glycosyltransferase involved in cell wall biosynthesis
MKKIAKIFLKWLVPVVLGGAVCRIANCLILGPVLLFHRRYVPLRTVRREGRETLGVLLNIIPDMTHIFIYREVASLMKRFPCAVAAVESGDERYATPLTRSITDGIAYMPPRDSGSSYARYYLCYLGWLLRHPVRVANLARLFEPELGGHPFRIADRRAAGEWLHPFHGFYAARMLEKRKIGHIHAYCTHLSATYALVAAHLLDVGFSFTAYVDFDFGYRFKMLDRKLELCDFAVVHTLFCKERLVGYTSERYRDKIHLVRISLDLEKFPPRPPSGSKRLRLLCIGGLVPKKGHRHLIRACKILKDGGLDFELLLIGDGPLRARLRELVSELDLDDRVTFLGGLTSDEVMNYFTPDATLVQPSVYAPDGERDGMPTVIAEAMAMGTPVISTHMSGIPEAVRSGANGILVPPEDTAALAAAIWELTSNQPLRQGVAEAGKRTVRELYDASRWILELEGFLRGSLRGAPAADEKV